MGHIHSPRQPHFVLLGACALLLSQGAAEAQSLRIFDEMPPDRVIVLAPEFHVGRGVAPVPLIQTGDGRRQPLPAPCAKPVDGGDRLAQAK